MRKEIGMNTLAFIRKQARKASARDGYSQVIIRDFDGDYSFSRKYPGCCPSWYGEIVEIIEHRREATKCQG